MIKKSFKTLVAEANESIRVYSLDEAKEMHGRPDVAFVDVREADEVAGQGRIPGAEHVPRGFIEFYADPESPAHRPVFASGKTIVLYCASAGRSALAARSLREMGLENVGHMAGGFKGWVGAGHPVEPK